MKCPTCPENTLTLFIRSITGCQPALSNRLLPVRRHQAQQFSSAARRAEQAHDINTIASRPSPSRNSILKASSKGEASSAASNSLGSQAVSATPKKEREAWQIQKAALKEKLGGSTWNPRKKLSPDTMEGIRHLHKTQPQRFTTAVLAQHFKVSPESVRRILKSKWQASDEEYEDRLRRWDKRGERIWTNLVELGIKPPKKWREMGVGKARNGQLPRWKSRSRNQVAVHDSAPDTSSDSIIPIVHGKSGDEMPARWQNTPFGERLA